MTRHDAIEHIILALLIATAFLAVVVKPEGQTEPSTTGEGRATDG